MYKEYSIGTNLNFLSPDRQKAFESGFYDSPRIYYRSHTRKKKPYLLSGHGLLLYGFQIKSYLFSAGVAGASSAGTAGC